MTLGEFPGLHKNAPSFCRVVGVSHLSGAIYASLSGTAQSPWLFFGYYACMEFWVKGCILEKLQAKCM